MKIVTVIGARPQFIKASVVSRAIGRQPGMQEVVIHTGQHFDDNMSQVFFEQLDIPSPAHHLGVSNAPHGAMTGRMLEGVEKVLMIEKPDWVLVYGDTNSTLAGALAARKMDIPVAHVEAGLRSFNLRMPEEINRILTDRVSTLLCCPTETAIQNLMNEGFAQFSCQLALTGDVMMDVALHYKDFAQPPMVVLPQTFFLATLHRAENTDDPDRLKSVFEALAEMATWREIVLPLHPRTAQYLRRYNITVPSGVHIIEPVGFLEMIYLIRQSELILTDSGGLQKEAFFHHRPCVTLRDETEWTELVDHGFNVVAGTGTEEILEAAHKQWKGTYNFDIPLYGHGDAAVSIVDLLNHTGG
ncbi:MAG: UDP-N-acetylglucosamine 2-epimerase (non-hydrolyzing) [Lentimicrobiaceae bacterium]|nr:UDP-N-acetylglucosamine 2-epimerase (non-hydrolyzing) [Lentimicrobiaceae bacterium]